MGYSSEYLAGLASTFNEGYKRFCMKKRNIHGKKVNRMHLLGGFQRMNFSDKES